MVAGTTIQSSSVVSRGNSSTLVWHSAELGEHRDTCSCFAPVLHVLTRKGNASWSSRLTSNGVREPGTSGTGWVTTLMDLNCSTSNPCVLKHVRSAALPQ